MNAEPRNTRRVQDVVAAIPRRLSLAPSRPVRFPLVPVVRFAVTALVVFLFLGSAQAPASFGFLAEAEGEDTATSTDVAADDGTLSKTQSDVQRSELEAQLADLETQIAEHQKTIESYQKQGKTLSGEITALNAKINKLNLQIKAVNLNLAQLNTDINNTQRQINQTENRIEASKDAIAQTIRRLYEADRESLFAIMMANSKLSDFFGNIENITLVQASLQNTLAEIVKLRGELLDQKQELALQKEDTENLRAVQESQKKSVQTTQAQKSTLLKTTKGKESEYKKILAKTQETAAQIRSRIFELLGGGELTFEKAYDYAKLASGATGVRAAMILAILNQESLLGKNTGRCTYDQIMKGGTTAMSPKETPIFLDLLSSLGIDPTSLVAKISCPNQDGTYGGAMGPAQFIPSTWRTYAASISAITGNTPANPWNNSDAFAGTALYLKNNGAAAQTAAAEKKAAAIYYCGSRWQRSACTYYANRAYEAAQGFQDDIDVLEANAGKNSTGERTTTDSNS
jgi:membrane-bound lytic murein transglycosylase B